MKALFIFDGCCGFCTKVVDRLIEFDKNNLVEFIPCQTFEKSNKMTDEFDCSKSIVYIDNNQNYPGAMGFAKFFDKITGLSIFSKIYKLPLCGDFSESVYRFIAKNRKCLPGVIPWCER